MRQEAMDPKTFQLIQEMRQAMKKPKITFTRVEKETPSVLPSVLPSELSTTKQETYKESSKTPSTHPSTPPSEINKPYFTIQETWGGRWEPGILTRSK